MYADATLGSRALGVGRMTDEDGPVRTQGWSKRLDDDWSPPEQHLNYAPPQGSTQSTREFQRPSLNDQWSANTLKKSKRGWIWVATGLIVLLLIGVVVGVLFTGGSSSKPPTAPSGSPTASVTPTTASTVNALQAVASQYQQYESTFEAALKSPNAAIAAANADIAQQDNRIANDQTTYQSNEFGSGCNVADFANYSSCVSQEQQTAGTAQSDENAAVAALKNDHAQLEAADQQIETVLSTFISQLDAVGWPTSTTQQDAGALAQALTNQRDAFAQEYNDLLNLQSITQDNSAISTSESDATTETINLNTALGLPPPSQGSTS